MVLLKANPLQSSRVLFIIHLHYCYSSEEAESVEEAVAAEAVSLPDLTDDLTQNTTYSETGSSPENSNPYIKENFKNYGNCSQRKSIIARFANFCCKS